MTDHTLRKDLLFVKLHRGLQKLVGYEGSYVKSLDGNPILLVIFTNVSLHVHACIYTFHENVKDEELEHMLQVGCDYNYFHLHDIPGFDYMPIKDIVSDMIYHTKRAIYLIGEDV